MKETSSNDYSNFYPSIINNISQSKDKKNEILKFECHHYLCPNCLKFPFIKFCKDRKNIRLTCSCVNNKKILIKEFLNKTNNFDYENSSLNIENELLCKKHKYGRPKKFEYFSKYFLQNYCEDCDIDMNNCIKFEDIEIEDDKIYQLNNFRLYEEISNNSENYKTLDINSSQEEENQFNKLINIIIHDYKNYPNISHFFNIKNLFEFFDIEEKLL